MNKSIKFISFFVLVASVVLNFYFYTNSSANTSDKNVELNSKLIDKNLSNIVIRFDNAGKIQIMPISNNRKLRIFNIGNERPINVKKFLPNKVIKTIDNLLIFSGSPTCIAHQGRMICG